jgi:hypothetical protein
MHSGKHSLLFVAVSCFVSAGQKAKAETMRLTRWERGALRLWIVVACAWTAFVALIEFEDVISVGVMPAIILGALGAGVMWAIRGFQGDG